MLKLPVPIQESVNDGTIAVDVGYRLTTIADPIEQAEVAQQAARGEIRRDEVRDRAKSPKPKGRGGKAGPSKSKEGPTPIGNVTVNLKRKASDEEIGAMLVELGQQLGGNRQQDAA